MEKYLVNKQDKTSLLTNRIVYDNMYHDQNEGKSHEICYHPVNKQQQADAYI